MRKLWMASVISALAIFSTIAAAQSNLINEQAITDWYTGWMIFGNAGLLNASFSAVNATTVCNATACWPNSPSGGTASSLQAVTDIGATTTNNINLEGDPSAYVKFGDEIAGNNIKLHQAGGNLIAEANNYSFIFNDGGNVVFDIGTGISTIRNITATKRYMTASYFCNMSSVSGAVGTCSSYIWDGKTTNTSYALAANETLQHVLDMGKTYTAATGYVGFSDTTDGGPNMIGGRDTFATNIIRILSEDNQRGGKAAIDTDSILTDTLNGGSVSEYNTIGGTTTDGSYGNNIQGSLRVGLYGGGPCGNANVLCYNP